MWERLQRAISVTLVACALIITILVVRREIATGHEPLVEPPQPDVVLLPQDWFALIAAGQFLTPRDAPLRIVVFADFECQYCREVQESLQRFEREAGDRLAIIFRHLPLDVHAHAFDAAVSAECAAEQDRFVAYHDVLFANQSQIGITSWSEFAESAGVSDLDKFATCLTAEWPRERVREDVHAAEINGIRGTPAFVTPDRIFIGASSVEALEEWIDESLRMDRTPLSEPLRYQ